MAGTCCIICSSWSRAARSASRRWRSASTSACFCCSAWSGGRSSTTSSVPCCRDAHRHRPPPGDSFSKNIEAISIVDKYLEHSRVFIFCNGGREKYFLSSADWMKRNLDSRSEVAIPIYDKEIQRELLRYIEIQWNDNTKARIINKKQDNQYRMDGE